MSKLFGYVDETKTNVSVFLFSFLFFVCLQDSFVHTVRNVPQNKFLASRSVSLKNTSGVPTVVKGKYEWDTYVQIFQEVSDLSKGLSLLGFTAGAGLGIFCKNRKEYVVAELASYCLSGYNTVIKKKEKRRII